MKKTTAFFLLLLIASTMGALYGALHDQVSYSVSEEYYTKFKFQQYRLAPTTEEWRPEKIHLWIEVIGVLTR